MGYSQVVGEGAEPARDGGQPSPGAVGVPIFFAAARRRAHGRRLPLTGGTGPKETPQKAQPQQVHTHCFFFVGSGESALSKKVVVLVAVVEGGGKKKKKKKPAAGVLRSCGFV